MSWAPWAHDMVVWYWLEDTLIWQLSIKLKTESLNCELPHLLENEISRWFFCSVEADG